MNIQPRQFIQSALLMALLCFIVLLFVISTQTTAQLNFGDNRWYLNRPHLIWHGILPDLFVYTFSYPVFVGAIDLIVHDVILSGMIANAVLFWCILLGVYILGHWLYGRARIAWLAVLLVFFNTALSGASALFGGTISFVAAVVWSTVACLLVVRRPSLSTALFLGGILALATYTRVEGAMYTIFIPIAGWVIYRRQRNPRLALQLFFVASLTFVILCIPFALNFISVNQHLDRALSDNVTGIFTLLNRTPIEWPVIWRRVTDTLTALILNWPTLAWIVGIAGVLWASPRFRNGQWFCAALIVFNLLYAYILAIWPLWVQVIFYVPFFALILAATLEQLILRGNWSRYLAQLLLALVLLPGILRFVMQATSMPVMNYRTSELAQTGRALDEWLQEEGWGQSHIYTLCSEPLSFSRSDFQLIYRLQFTTGWDSPERLIPQIRQEGALLMICGNEVNFPDWHPFLAQDVLPGLHEVGRFQNFIFYRPNGL